MEQPAAKLASVLVLTYNNMDGLYDTLDSIFAQDYPAMEVVLSDDASAEYARKQPEIDRYIREHRTDAITDVIWKSHERNVGTVRNSNDALRLSHGDYILSLASEDTLSDPSALSSLISVLEDTGEDICFGRLQGITPDGRTVDHLLSCESDYDLLKSYSVEQTRNRLFARNFLPAPCALMTRRLFERNGLYDESIRLIEDYPYWLTLTRNGVRFEYLDRVVVHYRLSGVSSTGHYSEAFMKDMFRIYDQYIFPYDHRYGILQPVYNALKRGGLSYYMARAGWDRFSPGKRAVLAMAYAPFFAYTGWLDWKISRKNRREGLSAASG